MISAILVGAAEVWSYLKAGKIVVKVGGSFVGGVYCGSLVWKCNQAEDMRVQRIVEPLVERLEAVSIPAILFVAPCAILAAHGTLAFITTRKWAKSKPMKPFVAIENAMGTYSISIPIILGSGFTIHCHSELKGEERLPSQLLRHLSKLFAKELFGDVIDAIESIANSISAVSNGLTRSRETISDELKGLVDALATILNFGQPESLDDILSEAENFSETLLEWQRQIREFDSKLHDYVTIAHAIKESIDTFNLEEIEAQINEIEAGNQILNGRKMALFFRLYFSEEDGIQALRRELEALRAIRNEIDQLFLKAEHLVEGMAVVARLNDVEVLAFINWEWTAAHMDLSTSNLAICHFMDKVRGMSSERGRSAENQEHIMKTLSQHTPEMDLEKQCEMTTTLSKEGIVSSSARDRSHFVASKRRALEARDPNTWRTFTTILTDIHALRKASMDQIRLVHGPQQLNIQRPFFDDAKKEVNRVIEEFQLVSKAFEGMRRPMGERIHQMVWERKVETVSEFFSFPATMCRGMINNASQFLFPPSN